MTPRDARYPFFASARKAVADSGVSLAALVERADPAVERARERVERALVEGSVAPEEPGEWTAREELLSYPVARILVSLLSEPAAVRKYAAAEAATAAERLREDDERDADLRSTPDSAVSLTAALREFDLSGTVREAEEPARPAAAPPRYWVGVDRYLALSDPEWGTSWRLATRELADGEVRVERAELFDLLEEAIRRRVVDGLPFEGVDDELAAALEDELAAVRALLADGSDVPSVDRFVPELLPSCVRRLRAKADEEELSPPEAFALLSVLAAVGLDVADVVGYLADSTLSVDRIHYQYARVADGDRGQAQYPPPTCETLAEYGVCENADGHRDDHPSPLGAYAARLAEGGESYTDWRDRSAEERAGSEA
ncbi:MAG: DNA primase [Halolamina sp.]